MVNDLDGQTRQKCGRRRYADLAWTFGSLESGQHLPPSQDCCTIRARDFLYYKLGGEDESFSLPTFPINWHIDGQIQGRKMNST